MSSSAPQKMLLVLPDDKYIVSTWKVRSGSVVQKGETVAIAVLRGSQGSDQPTPNVPPTAPTLKRAHKRPTKRRKPNPVAPASTAAPSDSKANTKPIATKTAPINLSSLAQASPSSSAKVKTLSAGQTAIVAPMSGIIKIHNSTPPDTGNPLEIGFVEECEHPTVVQGLCAVCGAPCKEAVPKNDEDVQEDEPNNTSASNNSASNMGNQQRITVSGGVTMTVSEREGMRLALEDTKRLQKIKKLSLVLDLDHTLVHATSDVRARQYAKSEPDVRTLVLPLVLDNQTQVYVTHYVKLRPHVKEFLEEAHEFYEVGVYTAGTRQYAEQITMLLVRHIIGSEYDATDLEEMRLKIIKLEKSFNEKSQNGSVKDDTDNNDKATESKSSEEKDDDSKPSAGQKRRRVTFGEPAAHEKTDEVDIEEELRTLKDKFDEALKVEQKAADLRQMIFGGRLVSRTDAGDLGRDVKSLKRMFPCGGSMAVVVDDREDVWANAVDNDATVRKGEPPHNLLMCKPYHWKPFLGFADVNNAAGEDLSGTDIAKDEDDHQLLWTLDVLRRLHFQYYAKGDRLGNGKSVPQLISEMRKNALKGCNILLSGLVPLHRQTGGDSQKERPRPQFVRHSESLGAVLFSKVESGLTHVVAAKDGTEKVLAARRNVPECAVVKPSWLMECAWTLTKRDVKRHLLMASASAAKAYTVSTINDGTGPKPPPPADRPLTKPADFESSLDHAKNEPTSDESAGDILAESKSDNSKQKASVSAADASGPTEAYEEDDDDDLEAAFAMELEEEEDD